MQTLPSATSAEKVPALPESWAEQLFRRLENFYGAKFTDSLGGIPRERVKQAWAEELAEYGGDEIKRGLEACRSRTWPPTLPEFLQLCRPLADAREDWAEACEQMALRLRDGSDVWSRPQVYWAALHIGAHDLHTMAYEQCRARWARALGNAMGDPVPPVRAALPTPGAQSVPRDEAQRRAAELASSIDVGLAKQPGKGWARSLMQRELLGEKLPSSVAESWRSALNLERSISAVDAAKHMEITA